MEPVIIWLMIFCLDAFQNSNKIKSSSFVLCYKAKEKQIMKYKDIKQPPTPTKPSLPPNLLPVTRHNGFHISWRTVDKVSVLRTYRELRVLYIKGGIMWNVVQVSRAETNNYIPQIMGDVITFPYPWYLLLVQHYSYLLKEKRNPQTVCIIQAK